MTNLGFRVVQQTRARGWRYLWVYSRAFSVTRGVTRLKRQPPSHRTAQKRIMRKLLMLRALAQCRFRPKAPRSSHTHWHPNWNVVVHVFCEAGFRCTSIVTDASCPSIETGAKCAMPRTHLIAYYYPLQSRSKTQHKRTHGHTLRPLQSRLVPPESSSREYFLTRSKMRRV